MPQNFYDADHEAFRASVREFVNREVTPNLDRWEEERSTGRIVWKAAGAQGILGIRIPEEFGGGGAADYRFRCVVQEELARVGAAALASAFSNRSRLGYPVWPKARPWHRSRCPNLPQVATFVE